MFYNNTATIDSLIPSREINLITYLFEILHAAPCLVTKYDFVPYRTLAGYLLGASLWTTVKGTKIKQNNLNTPTWEH